MTSAVKPQKEKPFGAAPRLAPRPTAASAARAARNATNRNATPPVQPRQSPTRSPPSPVSSKNKTNGQRYNPKTDSRTEIKINRNCENVLVISDLEQPRQELEASFVETDATIVLEDTAEKDHNYPSPDDDVAVQEADTFDSDIIGENAFKMEDSHNLLLDSRITKPNNTPVGSRPQTPRSLSSRPQTPRMPSRPTTPAHPAQRPGTPASRPNTPQRASLARPKTPTTPTSARPLTPVQGSQIPLLNPTKRDDLKTTFIAEHQHYLRMKKDLDLKQQAFLEVFEELRNLRECMHRENISGGEVELQEFMMFNVGDWAADEVARLCRGANSDIDGAVSLIDTIVPFDEGALTELEAKAMSVPVHFGDLCIQVLTARQEIIDWMKNIIVEQNMENQEMNRITQYNARGLELCDALRELKSQANDAVATVTKLSKRAFRERAALIRVGESLVREVARLRQDLETRGAAGQEVHETRAGFETTKALEEVRRELNEEKAAKNAMKEKLVTAESQLRQARARVNKMDRQLREAEASIASLTGTVKSLEDQSRQKEVHLEARARKLKESLKTGEMASSQLSHQRDALQAEVSELKEQIQTINTQHSSALQELGSQIKELIAALEEERKTSAQEREQKESFEKAYRDNEYIIEELKAKIVELENSKPNPELPTEREMDLWAELQATKDVLRSAEDEISACKKEKNRFLETLTKISETEDTVGLQHKLAAELLSKEEIVSKMQAQIRELMKNIKLNEQKVIQYEQYVRDLQAHNRAVANCQESPNGTSYQDLQKEIMNLRMSLLETAHKNEELSALLIQKDQQLEHQDKTSRAQARVIKVREELINLLKNKETEQSRELAALQQDLEHRMKIVDDVNKQIAAKADEIQELFATLENKQQQIHRLEKIVLALEEQQRRAQAQRTRQEEKIAALEHELAAGSYRREKKFLFF